MLTAKGFCVPPLNRAKGPGESFELPAAPSTAPSTTAFWAKKIAA